MIDAKAITVRRSGQTVLDAVSLTLGTGEVVGVVGPNGSGKTTLLRSLFGACRIDGGEIRLDDQPIARLSRRAIARKIAVVPQVQALEPEQTVYDMVSLGRLPHLTWLDSTGARDDAAIVAALERVGLAQFAARPLRALSGGELQRAMIARALCQEAGHLLLDEPTNHLDREGRASVLDLLAGWRMAALVVSHDRELLEQMDAIVELTSLGARRYGGNYTIYSEQKAVERAALAHDLAHAEKTLDQMERRAQQARERQDRRDAGGRRKAARGDMPKILLGGRKENAENSAAAGSRLADRQITEAVGAREAARARVEIVTPLTITLPPTHLPAGRVVLDIADLAVGYEPDRPLLCALSFRLTGPERLALIGPNGSGKSTLLAAIAGHLTPLGGSIRTGARIARLDQRLADHRPEETVLSYLRRLNPDLDDRASRARLAQFMFRADAALQLVGTLSGGETLRAGLAATIGSTRPPELLILDEPTNHLDIDAIAELEAGLRAYDGALLVVSHDRAFLDAVGITREVGL